MGKLSLLYIDDERINLLAFKAQFRREFEVYCVWDAQDAFKCLEENSIDFVFSDQRMPKISGTEFLSRVKVKYPKTRCSIISGFIEDVAIKNSLKNGIVDIAFEKPYRTHEIEEFIKKNANDNT